MKPTLLDRVIGYISPTAAVRRIQARAMGQHLLRAYDGASTYPTQDWVSAQNTSANAEIKGAQAKLRERARDLARNNPYAVRALNVIVSNTVGAGIVPNIRGKNDKQTEALNLLWKQWAETPMCDWDGRHTFYGLQALVLRSTAESGEGLAVLLKSGEGPKIRLMESDFLVTTKDEGSVVQGVEFDKNGRRTKYHLYKTHPGDSNASDKTVTVAAEEVSHVYRIDRPGQVRGVSWAHAVIEPQKDLDDYQRTTLVKQKVSACFGGFIETPGTDALLDAAALKAKRESEMTMTPATWRYLSPGEKVTMANPPGVDGYADFVRVTLHAIAAGWGISYEALTGDYSQVNFSSGRMGHMEMRRNIDMWRWTMLIPLFCDWGFKAFLAFAAIKAGVKPEDVTVQWVPPAHVMIDPSKEIEALKKEVRSGFKTYGQAVREQGYDPDDMLKEIAEWNTKIDKFGISLDSDPRRMSSVGFAQAGESLDKLGDVPNKTTEEGQEGDQESEQDEEEAPGQPDSGESE